MGPPSTSHFVTFAETPSGVFPLHKLNRKRQNHATPESRMYKFTDEVNSFKLPRNYGLHGDVYIDAEANIQDDSAAWTDQETLSLLEAVDMYKEDWGKVSDYVNKTHHRGDVVRTHDDCILAFIRLPIEDPYLSINSLETTHGRQSDEEFPLRSSTNPLMATLAFLTQAVDPVVAAAGAEHAIMAISKAKAEKDAKQAAKKRTEAKDTTTTTTTTTDATTPTDADTKKDADAMETETAAESTHTEDTHPAKDDAGKEDAAAASKPKAAEADASSDAMGTAAVGSKSAAGEEGTTDRAKTADAAAVGDSDILDSEALNKLSQSALNAAAEKAKTLARGEEQRMKALIATLVQV